MLGLSMAYKSCFWESSKLVHQASSVGFLNSTLYKIRIKNSKIFKCDVGRGEICIRVNLSTGQWVYLYTFFSNFRVQNRGDICIHKRSKQE